MKKLKVLAMLLALVIMATGCGKKDETKNLSTLEKIKKEGKLLVGLEDTYPPMEYRDENNNLVGFDIDFSNEIAKKLGVKAEFVTTEFAGITMALNSGKFDMIASAISITPDREKEINFSKSYITNGVAVVVKKGNESIKGINDLKGKILGCQLGSTGQDAAEKIEGTKDVVKYDKATDVFNDLYIGRIDAIVIDEPVGLYYASKKADAYVLLDEKLDSEPVGLGFRKADTELQATVQKAIDEMMNDGTMSQLSIKWFGTDIYKK